MSRHNLQCISARCTDCMACYGVVVLLIIVIISKKMPLGVNMHGLKIKFKTDKKLEKARGPVGRRIRTALNLEQR